MRYVILYADGMTSIGALQAMMMDPATAAADDMAADSLAAARERFAEIIRETYRDGIPTGDGGPWADVVPAAAWDGITYATDGAYRITVGPRGGIRGEHF